MGGTGAARRPGPGARDRACTTRAASLLALRDSVLAVELLVVGALVALWSGVPDVPTVCVLAAVAVVAGAELVVDRRVPVPPVLGVVVVAVALAVGPDDAVFAAALVAGLATAVSWWVRGRHPTVGVTLAVCGASALGVAAASVGTAEVHSDVAVLGLGVAAAAGFGLIAAMVARSRRRAEAAALVWVTPLAVLAAMGGMLDGWSAAAAVAFTCATLGVAVVLGAWCGSTPWRSRCVSR